MPRMRLKAKHTMRRQVERRPGSRNQILHTHAGDVHSVHIAGMVEFDLVDTTMTRKRGRKLASRQVEVRKSPHQRVLPELDHHHRTRTVVARCKDQGNESTQLALPLDQTLIDHSHRHHPYQYKTMGGKRVARNWERCIDLDVGCADDEIESYPFVWKE